MKFAIAIRGHERSCTKQRELNIFVQRIRAMHDCDVYVQTWNYTECEKSWRPIQKRNKITEKDVREYFSCDLKSVIVIDEDNLDLPGDQSGFIGRTLLPKKAWKNMWLGKSRIAEEIVVSGEEYAFVLNLRFDHFSCIYCQKMGLNMQGTISFVENCITNDYSTKPILFASKKKCAGIDNIYSCTTCFFDDLTTEFYVNLDDILRRHKVGTHQEFLLHDIATLNACFPSVYVE